MCMFKHHENLLRVIYAARMCQILNTNQILWVQMESSANQRKSPDFVKSQFILN